VRQSAHSIAAPKGEGLLLEAKEAGSSECWNEHFVPGTASTPVDPSGLEAAYEGDCSALFIGEVCYGGGRFSRAAPRNGKLIGSHVRLPSLIADDGPTLALAPVVIAGIAERR